MYCKNCIQSWVKTKVTSGSIPNCPMCRSNIVTIEMPKTYVNYNYDSDSSDGYLDRL